MNYTYNQGVLKVKLYQDPAEALAGCRVDPDADCEKFFYDNKYFSAQAYYDYRIWKVNYKSNPKSKNERLLKKYKARQEKEYDPFTDIDIQIIENILNGTNEPVKIHQVIE